MIKTNTVFILGSGASKPYNNFPTDAELRKRIIQDFNDDYLRLPYTSDFNLRMKKFEVEKRKKQVYEFLERLGDLEGTTTIDEFIDVNNKYEFIGRIAIQHYLLKYERDYLSSRKIKYERDWFEIVLKTMLKECKEKKDPSLIESNSVNFVTFNYDRLIEYLFIKQFRSLFNELLNTNYNKNLIDFFLYYKLIHVYGSLGYLHSKSESQSFSEVTFGEEIMTYERIIETVKNVKLIKDGFSDIYRIEKRINSAEKIFFLGFGYVENNMKILNLENCLNFMNPPYIYGTAFNKDKSAIDEIKKEHFSFNKKIPEPIIEPLNCKDLIEKYF